MAPDHRPWWRVDADTDESEKLARLPNDSARWAWFRTGCRAKTQRRMGIFAGRQHLKTMLGVHGRYIPDLVRVGALHDWPIDCERCQKDYPDADPGDVVVHDYRRKQVDPTAADRQAKRYGKSRDPHSDSHGQSHGDSHADITPSSRALSPSLSTSPSENYEERAVPSVAELAEPYATVEVLTNFPVQRWERSALKTLDDLVDRRGIPAVVGALRAVSGDVDPQPPAPWPLIAAARNRLEPIGQQPRLTPAERKAEEHAAAVARLNNGGSR